MLSVAQWRMLSAREFESLALNHVSDVYPEYDWRLTPKSSDGGKDAIGELRAIDGEISQLYWMEAKHQPTQRSIGKYTIDTHLVSTYFVRGRVKRLHVVTSGAFSAPFLVRAASFAAHHGFEFAYSDHTALELWLSARRDLLRRFFASRAAEIEQAVARSAGLADGNEDLQVRAFVLPEDDSLRAAGLPTATVVPGRKYLLVVLFSLARRLPSAAFPLRLDWSDERNRVHPLNHYLMTEGLQIDDLSNTSIVSVPFRFTRYSAAPLASPRLTRHDLDQSILIPLQAPKAIPRLPSPFVGQHARDTLLKLTRLLHEEISHSRPRLVTLRGRAGCGKSRLAEEVRDEAQRAGFSARVLVMTSTSSGQLQRWRLLFRWLLGLEHNPFDVREDELLGDRLDHLRLGSRRPDLQAALEPLLLESEYNPQLFDLEHRVGRLLADAVDRVLAERITRPTLLHIEDAQNLSRQMMSPLFFFKHLVESRDSMPLCLLVTCRDDETAPMRTIDHLLRALESTASERTPVIHLADFTAADAKELVSSTLGWPELLASESQVMDAILSRSGTNAFCLRQTIDHLAIDSSAVDIHDVDGRFIVDVPRFKQALSVMPEGISDILSQRLNGLAHRANGRLLQIVTTASVFGRESKGHIVARAAGSLTEEDLQALVTLGYLMDVNPERLVLAHDLLVEAAVLRPEAATNAGRLAESLDESSSSEVDDELRAHIHYRAGEKYYVEAKRSAETVVRESRLRDDYLGLRPYLGLLEKIEEERPDLYAIPQDIAFVAAVADQHCGNTLRALERFEVLQRDALATRDSAALARYIEATIEIGNQRFLRAEPTLALSALSEALEVLTAPGFPIPADQRDRFFALTYDRMGAVNNLVDRPTAARQNFMSALEYALRAEDHYLVAHAHRDLAVLLRYRDPPQSQRHLTIARDLWASRLAHKDRMRIMLETMEAYSKCLQRNSPQVPDDNYT